MKKLMIAAAIVCAAAIAQAASINWSIGNNAWTLQSGSKAAKNYQVYLINAADKATVIEAINGGKTSFTTGDPGILGTGLTTNTKGAIDPAVTASSKSLTAGTDYTYSVLVIDTTSVAGSTYYNISDGLTKAAYDVNDPTYYTATSIAFSSTQFKSGTGWQKVSGGGDVPEPTSAMLLVLGIAGLALKRRRA